MKKFSKLLAVVLAIAVIICPMMIFAETSTSSGTYKIELVDANTVQLTINSTDGFVAYHAIVGFNKDDAFQSSYNDDGYVDGLKVISYTLKTEQANDHNKPTIRAHASGTSLNVIVMPSDTNNLDLCTKIVIGIRVASGATASLTKIQAADNGTVDSDNANLLTFPAANASTGEIDQADEYAKENATITVHTHDLTPVSAKDATCTEPGNTAYYTCSCGKIFRDSEGTDETTLEAVTIPATGHSFTNYVSNNDATCTEDGTKTATCDNGCGETKTITDEGSALGHTPATAVVENNVPATCTTDGSYDSVVKCSVCKTELSRETVNVPATGHTPDTAVEENRVEATCGVDGHYDSVVYCSECEAEISRNTIVIPATGNHTWGEWTTDADGHSRTCSVCNTVDSGTHDGNPCSVCGYEATPAEPVIDPNLANIIVSQRASVDNKIGIFFSIQFKNPNKSGYEWSFDDFNFIVSKKLLDSKTYSYTGETQEEVFSTSRYDQAFSSVKAYRFTYNKVGLYEMGSELTYTVKLFTGGVCTAQYTWEPTSLTEALTNYYLQQGAGTTLRNALADILNLGEACRQYFGNEKSTNAGNNTLSNMSPLNASVSAEDGCKDYGSLSIVEGQRDAAFSSVKLSLADAPSLYYTFRDASFKDVSTVTFTVSFTSMNTTLGDSGAVQQEFAATELPEAYTRYAAKTGGYNFSFEDAPLYDVDKVITLVVSNGATSYTHQYSVLSLLAEQLPTATTLAAGVYEAVARFNVSCQAQFAGNW